MFDLVYIKSRRQELGLSTEDMAKAMGYANHSVYWKYETGAYKWNAGDLPELAAALQCKVSDFFTDESSISAHNAG